MKHYVIYEIIKQLRRNPKLMRKVKIFAVAGLFGIIITGSLMIWAGVTAVKYVANKTTEVVQSPATTAQFDRLKADVKSVSQFQVTSCWEKTTSLIAVTPWVERPVFDNLMQLKAVCFQENPKQGS